MGICYCVMCTCHRQQTSGIDNLFQNFMSAHMQNGMFSSNGFKVEYVQVLTDRILDVLLSVAGWWIRLCLNCFTCFITIALYCAEP